MIGRPPEVGPGILFFSGGTALRDTSRALTQLTHNSVHIITPFDSGGSSARLRAAFDMPSIGDLRNRLLALADESVEGAHETYRLFSFRLPPDAEPDELLARLRAMAGGADPLVSALPEPIHREVRSQLEVFLERAPDTFDLRGASVGNLILAGGYLRNGRDLDEVLDRFSHLVRARGTVRPVVTASLHLESELANGERVIGQHALTAGPSAPVRALRLVDALERPSRCEVAIEWRIADLIRSADMICYPIGSFYSSVAANLLPRGVGNAIRQSGAPKLYVPNAGEDPEQCGMSVIDAVAVLRDLVSADVDSDVESGVELGAAVQLVLLDTRDETYARAPECEELRNFGVEVVRTDLVTAQSFPLLDASRLAEAIASLA